MHRVNLASRVTLAITAASFFAVGCAEESSPLSSISFRSAPARVGERVPLAKRPLRVPSSSSSHTLVVKFVDAAEVRAGGGDPRSRTGRDLAAVRRLAAQYGAKFSPLLRIPEERVASLLDRARAKSGRAQPDLLGLHSVVIPAASLERLVEMGDALQSLDVVEFAYFQVDAPPSPATDIAPVTPDLLEYQGYRGASGIDMEPAAAMGLDGTGIRVSDVEYNWNIDHEAWNDASITIQPGHTIPPDLEFDGSHGTAVAGELIAHGDGYGVTGLIPGALLFAYPQISIEGGNRRVDAIASAVADSSPGDVVLLEIQTNENTTGLLGPGELEEAVWMATRVGVDAGVVIVAAAGNGALDLDREELAYYRNRGDSGAIIVGAGDSVSRARLQFSTFGARVDVQGWGEDVFTTGYGHFAAYGGDVNQQYTGSFSGTSSASPIVAGAAVLLQQAAVAKSGPLTSEQMRAVLVGTGLPQTSGNPIGPLPQVSAALQGVLEPDAIGPTVTFITPSDNVAVEETFFETDLEIDAQDASNVITQVQISIGGELLSAVDSAPPFAFEGVTFPEGTWEVVAIATDVWGNVGESLPLTIAVGVELPSQSTGPAASSSGDDSTSSEEGSGTGDSTTGPPTPPPPEDDSADGSEATGTASPSGQSDDAGCGCTTRRGTPNLVWLLFGLFALRRRRA